MEVLRHRRRYRSGTHDRGGLPRRGPQGGDRRRAPRRPRGRRQGTRRRRHRLRQHRRRPASKRPARLFPHHLDTIVNVPAPRWDAGDPRTYTLAERAAAWRSALDATDAVGGADRADPRRSPALRRLDRQRRPRQPARGQRRTPRSRRRCRTGPPGQATHFGTRGITVNAVASGRSAEPGYDGLGSTSPPVAAEITRLALFLTTPAARHITGQTLHVSHGALAHFG